MSPRYHSALIRKVIHLDVEDQMTVNGLISDRNLFTVVQELESRAANQTLAFA